MKIKKLILSTVILIMIFCLGFLSGYKYSPDENKKAEAAIKRILDRQGKPIVLYQEREEDESCLEVKMKYVKDFMVTDKEMMFILDTKGAP